MFVYHPPIKKRPSSRFFLSVYFKALSFLLRISTSAAIETAATVARPRIHLTAFIALRSADQPSASSFEPI